MNGFIEVLAFRQESNQSKPNVEEHAEYQSYTSALSQAKKWAKKYWRVEVYDVLTDDDDWAIEQDELIACWEDGVKTI